MAALGAAHIMSGSSHFTSRVSDLDFLPLKKSRAALGKTSCYSHQLHSLNGLRSTNMIEDRIGARSLYKRVARKGIEKQTARSSAVISCNLLGMKVIFVSAEVAPWSKTGGLGDVLGGLPAAMAANGHRVMTVSPRYDQYKDAWDTSVLVELMGIDGKIETVRFFHVYKRGVDRVFVDHPIFLEKVWGKTGGKLYGPTTGDDYDDNQLRFSLLCQAALEAPRVLNLNSSAFYSGPYGEDVIFVANDWHTALLPCYLKSVYQSKGLYKNAKVAFCIHNIAYQGRFAISDFTYLNLPDSFRSSFDFVDGYMKPVPGRKINWLKAGLLEADGAATVSPYYAEEVASSIAKGVELDGVIRQMKLTGILNGMDVVEWSPETDKYASVNYDATTVLSAKPVLKENLQAEVGLPVDRDIPVMVFIGRLEEQKGSDILVEAVPEFIGEDMQLIILGTGKKKFEKQIEELEEMFPDKVRGVAKFNVPLAHKMLAGADLVLIPSRFEPCGLVQFQAMLKGTIPIAPKTGGLADTVLEGVTGFQMEPFDVNCEAVDPADVASIVKTVKRALSVYGTPVFTDLIQNCMARDWSWKGPAKNWEEFLLSLGAAGNAAGIDGVEMNPTAKENVPTP